MSTFLVRVEALTGTTGETTDMSDWLTAGARFIVDMIPEDKALRYTTTGTDNGTTGVDVSASRVFGAYKSGYRAIFLHPGEYARYVDSASRFYGTSTIPVAYILNGTLFVKPGGGTAQIIAYPTVAHGDSTITGFPIEWEQAVVLYAAVQYAQYKVNLTYTNWVTYTETNKDIELGDAELRKLQTQLQEAKTNLDSLNVQLQNYLALIGIKPQ